MNFISREEVLAILDAYYGPDNTRRTANFIRDEIEKLYAFPAPNPNWKNTNRNVMGQTEDQFWAAVEVKCPSPLSQKFGG